MESEDVNPSMNETEEAKPKNFFSRLGDVYLSPKEAFEEIGRSPRVLVPIIALILIGLVTGFVLANKVDIQSIVDSQIEAAISKGQPPQQIEQARPLLTLVFKGIITCMFFLGCIFNSLILAGFIKLFSALAGAKNRFKSVFSMALFSVLAISLIQQILMIVIAFIKGTVETTLSNIQFLVASNLGAVVGSIMGEDALPIYLMHLFRYVDFFTIWMIVLLAIGSAAVSKKLKTSTAAAWLGGAYAIIALIGALFSSRSPVG